MATMVPAICASRGVRLDLLPARRWKTREYQIRHPVATFTHRAETCQDRLEVRVLCATPEPRLA